MIGRAEAPLCLRSEYRVSRLACGANALVLMLAMWGGTARSDDDAAPPAAPTPAAVGQSAAATERQYTFAWPFVDGSAMAPRGATTRGKAVTLDRGESEAWRRLREPGLTPFERDRRAILAMAGEYRASFDFIEVLGLDADHTPQRPYQSWGTEKVYVLEDRGNFISLQHVLVMRILDQDGTESEPFVTKHWRQDWQYEPESVLSYLGHATWALKPVAPEARAGAWSQTVYQVDDSPRYGDVARWTHFGNYSSWGSSEGWRPLPRREFSVRSDYHVLIGSNRHTILPSGWVHEQQNNKVVLDAAGVPDAAAPVRAREFGFNRYERIVGFDFAAGDRYLERTAPLWRAVRQQWADLLANGEPLRLRGAPDQQQLFMPLFQLADQTTELESAEIDRRARELVRAYLRTDGAPTAASRY